MLFYHCVRSEELRDIRRHGIDEPVVLRTSRDERAHECEDNVLLVDPEKLSMARADVYEASEVRVDAVPARAILNLNPYQRPIYVIAGGGFILRNSGKNPDVLMIYRKGVWDLPKGKLDEGETFEQCAVREVQEEVGIEDIRVVQALGSTMHSYERKNEIYIKRTYWYHMTTKETSFRPQYDEQIERVAWMKWSEAKENMGYPIFRMHMDFVEKYVLDGRGASLRTGS